MRMERFDHVNVRTADLAAMVAWYGEVLGLHPGNRPGFSFGGAWLYCGRDPIIHLVEVKEKPKAEQPRLEHFALAATGLAEFLARLDAKGIRYECGEPPNFGITQVNLWDPDGNHIHIDFKETRAA